MDKTTLDTLNQLLKGEEMAISSYAKFIHDAEDANLKNEFKNIQKEHNKHAQLLSERIIELGGTPQYGTGVAGVMADVRYAFESMGDRKDYDVLKEAWHGEDQGVAMAEKVADDKLDDKSRVLVHDIMQMDHDHIRKLEKLLDEYRIQ
ncbi:MAG: PA2169 family four-helix-bundle protein [Clostridia bacterium]|nr:PA2169 family four-helix-bundle protein [Clostridia bacterium]